MKQPTSIKTLFTLFILSLSFNAATAQTAGADPSAEAALTSTCTVGYSETKGALIYLDSLQNKVSQIIIRELPPLSEENTPINIGFVKGSYTFAKSPDLVIPADYRIYVEDQLTETKHNLNASEGFAFKVGRGTTDFGRFILHIERPVSRLSAAGRGY